MRLARFASAATALAFALAAAPSRAEGERTQLSAHPSLRVTTEANDNLFFEEDGEEGGVGVWIAPRVEVGYRRPALELGADLGVDLRRYPDETSLDDEFYRMSGFAQLALLPGLSLRIADAYVPQPLAVGRPDDDTANLVQTHRADATLRYWRELLGTREIELGVRGARLFSESFSALVPAPGGGAPVIADPFRADYWETAGDAEWRTPLGEASEGYALAQAGFREFDDSRRPDHVNASLLLGMRTRPRRDLELELAGGWGLLAFLSSRDHHRPLGKASLRYQPTGAWIWQLSLANEFRSNLAGNEGFEASARLGAERQLGERTAASASVFVAHFEDEVFDRGVDRYGGVEAGLARQLGSRAQLALRYRHWVNGGSDDGDDFHQNRVMLEVAYRL